MSSEKVCPRKEGNGGLSTKKKCFENSTSPFSNLAAARNNLDGISILSKGIRESFSYSVLTEKKMPKRELLVLKR